MIEPIVVNVEPLKVSDFWWNQIYWWRRTFWRRILAFFMPLFLLFFYWSYVHDDQDLTRSLILSLVSATAGLFVIYLIDIVFFIFQNFFISTKHKKLREKSYSITFSEEDVTSTDHSCDIVSSYDHYERFFFYNRHLVLQPVGLRNYYVILKWSDVPQDRISDLKELLKRKTTKE